MLERRPNTQTVQWFLEAAAQGQLQLEASYQRRTVWSLSYRQYFIDTVLRNYPSPAIFLAWQIRPGKQTIYEVVDGKQRLSAILSFTKDEFHLGDLFDGEGKQDAYWSDLGADLQNALVTYVFTVENITGASNEELRDAFDRLNRNVAQLTPQELRHAQYGGSTFAVLMETLAEDSFWSENRIVTPANVRRMRDVEFIAELFVYAMEGVQDGAAGVLDQYYADLGEDFPDQDLQLAAFRENLGWIKMLDLDWRKTRWNNMSDFYALWGAVDTMREEHSMPDPATAIQPLVEFDTALRAINKALREGNESPGTRAQDRYFDAARQGPNKEANRSTRIRVLTDLLSDEG